MLLHQPPWKRIAFTALAIGALAVAGCQTPNPTPPDELDYWDYAVAPNRTPPA
jgi:hypothetical protein